MLLNIILIVIGFILLIKGADFLVDGSSDIAKRFHIPEIVIGLTIVSIGTSLPEMTMTIVAAKKEEFDIALGNIIGTNIFNIGVVLGLPLIIFGGFSSTSFNLIDIFAVHLAAFVLYIFAKNDKVLNKLEGAIMIIIFVLYYTYIMVV